MHQTNGHVLDMDRGAGPPSNERGRFGTMYCIVVIQNRDTFVIKEGGRDPSEMLWLSNFLTIFTRSIF